MNSLCNTIYIIEYTLSSVGEHNNININFSKNSEIYYTVKEVTKCIRNWITLEIFDLMVGETFEQRRGGHYSEEYEEAREVYLVTQCDDITAFA